MGVKGLKQHDFLLITKTRKMREVLIIQGGRGEEGERKLIIRCMFCLQVDRPITKGLATKGAVHKSGKFSY